MPRRRRTSRSLTGARALPPFVEEIPAFLVNPSPGLVPAAAANTVVFTGGIKVLLKGLTWPGVINSWFLGTVRGDDAPFASLLSPASPVDRTSDPPRAFPARARNVTMNQDNRYFRLALQPGGVVRRREGRRWSDNEQISDSAANERASPRTRPVHHPSPSFPNPCPTRRNTTTHAYSPTTQLQTVMAAFGVGGYVLVCLYFVFGSAVTKIKLEQKQAEGIAEARGGRRGVGSVWGSGIAGIACACLALAGVGPGENLWRLGFVASFCSKLSDTTASEVGKAYGKTTYMSTPPFRSVPRGTEGAVSLEGTVAGIGASLGFAGVAAAAGQVDLTGALIATLAAFIATTAESWLGATTQGEAGFEWLTNDVVNAVQITLAAAVAVALGAAVGCG